MNNLDLILKNIDELYSSKSVIGSEDLFIILYEINNSLLKELLDLYDVDDNYIYDLYDNLLLIRKNNIKYTKVLLTIIDDAKIYAKSKGEQTNEFHLIYAILKYEDSVAHDLFKRLYLDIDELILELQEFAEGEDTELINLTKLAKQQKLGEYIDYKDYLKRIQITLSKKIKNNPLLIGDAGVGKTAIIEGLASKLAKENSNMEILSLSLGGLVANTKYRGDFEGKLLDIINFIKKESNRVLFIDEIHNILGCGKTEGSMDAANILKPVLAREGFKCIGATTIDEYLEYIKKDKALSRRFEAIFISEPSKKDTLKILKGIKSEFEEFYSMDISDDILDYIINLCDYLNKDKRFPDKAIDLLDEALSIAKSKKNTIGKKEVDEAIFYLLGKQVSSDTDVFEKYRLYYDYQIKRKTLLNILYKGDNPDDLINDLENVFNIPHEQTLKVFLQDYKENDLSSLVGSAKGYIGYDEGGLVTRHLAKYQQSIICFYDYDNCQNILKNFVDKLLNGNNFHDNFGNYIDLSLDIFICISKKKDEFSVGFIKNKQEHTKCVFDEVINDYQTKVKKNNIIERLEELGFEIECYMKDEILLENALFILKYFKTASKGKYIFKYSEFDKFIIDKA